MYSKVHGRCVIWQLVVQPLTAQTEASTDSSQDARTLPMPRLVSITSFVPTLYFEVCDYKQPSERYADSASTTALQ